MIALSEYRALLESRPLSGQVPFFCSAHWILPWLDHYARPGDVFFAPAGEPLPLMRRHGSFHGLPMRELRFVATGDEERDEVATEFCDLMENDASRFQEVLRRPDWDLCTVENVTADSRVGAMLAQAGAWASRAGMHYRIALPGSIDAWVETLGSSSRSKVRRTWRQMDAMSLTCDIRSGADALAFLPALIQLHRTRWGKRDMPGAFDSDRFTAFHRALLQRPQSPAHIALLAGPDAPIAAWYGFDFDGTRFYYQSGFDAPAGGHFSPGLAMHLCMIEDAIQRRLDWYDFMKGGQQSYKSHFGAQTSPLLHWRLPGPSLRGRMLALALRQSRNWQRCGVPR